MNTADKQLVRLSEWISLWISLRLRHSPAGTALAVDPRPPIRPAGPWLRN